MKVHIGPYKNWYGPYQLAETICFWAKKDDKFPEWVHTFGEWLAHGNVENDESDLFSTYKNRTNTLLYKFLIWIDSKKKRKISIRIDKWDTWSMDSSLAYIVLPMLKQLRDTTHGYQLVDMEDVPENLRCTERNDYDAQMDLFDFPKVDFEPSIGELRWNWILNEMIFAFEKLTTDDWESEFYSGDHDLVWTKEKDGYWTMGKGPNDTFKIDREGLDKCSKRIDNGLRLFGKYYRGLWD